MKIKEELKELFVVLLASVILAVTVSFTQFSLFSTAILSFIIIIGVNVLIKKLIGYHFETKVITKFWSVYHYGFRKDAHFKKPLPMLWLPLIATLLTKGFFWWFAILEFDVAPKTERVSRRHGLYRFTEVTEWHMGLIATWGIIINLILAIIGYLIGFETFAKFSIYYAAWSIVPLSNLDGAKILFSNKGLWLVMFIIAIVFFTWGLAIV